MNEDYNKNYKLFMRFLKDKNILFKIINNINKKPNNFRKDFSIAELFNHAINHIPNNPLRSRRIGFDWEKSFEGFDFWNNMHIELENFLKKQIYEN